MIFSILMIILVLAVAFFHYVQGFFSAMISAICAIIAACMAMSYHEPLTNLMLRGYFADQATAITMIGIFVLTYSLLRWAFDRTIPGNVRLPAVVDKIGAGAMGVVAGCFATGIVAVAAQSMPMHASIAQYSRYPLEDERTFSMQAVAGNGKQIDAVIEQEMEASTFEETSPSRMLLPVDDIVVGTVNHLSGGSLPGSQQFSTVHPDYLQELFAQRAGLQASVRHTAMEVAGRKAMTVEGVYTTAKLNQIDAELLEVRKGEERKGKFPKTIATDNAHLLLIIRAKLYPAAADPKDKILRFTPGSFRLVANGKNYYPVGTIGPSNTLFANKVDDPIAADAQAERSVDFVFYVDPEDVLEGGDANAADLLLKNDVFLEFKRYVRWKFTDQPVERQVPPQEDDGMARKPLVVARAPAAAPVATEKLSTVALGLVGKWTSTYKNAPYNVTITPKILEISVGSGADVITWSGPWVERRVEGTSVFIWWDPKANKGDPAVPTDMSIDSFAPTSLTIHDARRGEIGVTPAPVAK